MNEERISAAVEECLKRCQGTQRPFYELSRALEVYKNDPAWTAEEVVELQTRVIRRLMSDWFAEKGHL